MYGVWCQVSGGVTGFRQAWLKKNGEVLEFSTFEEADAHAEHLNEQMNGPHATASFSYEAREL